MGRLILATRRGGFVRQVLTVGTMVLVNVLDLIKFTCTRFLTCTLIKNALVPGLLELMRVVGVPGLNTGALRPFHLSGIVSDKEGLAVGWWDGARSGRDTNEVPSGISQYRAGASSNPHVPTCCAR